MDISLNPLPLVEGKCPPVCRYTLRDGRLQQEWYYPEQDESWKDPEIYETEEYMQADKEELYDYVTICKKCQTRFIAYNNAGERAINYCPFCGEQLETKVID